MESIGSRHREKRKVWAPNQVLTRHEIVPGMVYREQCETIDPYNTRFLVGLSIPYEKNPNEFWAGFIRVDNWSIGGNSQGYSLSDRAVEPYYGVNGPHWNRSNWLEKIGTCLEVQDLEEIPQEIRNSILLIEIGARNLPNLALARLNGKLTWSGELVNNVLFDLVRKEIGSDTLWSRVLKSRLVERMNALSSK